MNKLLLAFISFLPLMLQAESVTPKQAYQKLVEGNQRFAAEKSNYPDRTAERRRETAEKQMPFATLVGCSDSRVAPEILFDQGIGDLFIVRVAGNVVGPLELDSIEYSVLYLNSSLVVVFGHESCGAVNAVLQGTTKDIEDVAQLIQPAADKTQGQTKDRLENTIKENAKMVAEQLKKTEVLGALYKKKKIDIVAGYYNFHTGKVEFLK